MLPELSNDPTESDRAKLLGFTRPLTAGSLRGLLREETLKSVVAR